MREPVDPSGLRIGTAEREAAVAALGEHFAAGRLTLEEYERRVGAAVQARTRAELDPLFTDLPGPHPGPPVAPGVGPGRLPVDLHAELIAEGLLVLAEDLPGTMTDRGGPGPGRWARRRTVAVRGTVAVSRRRLLVWAAGAKRVDMPFRHALWPAVEVSTQRGDWLRVRADAGAFGHRPGQIELRLRTDQASAIADMLAASR